MKKKLLIIAGILAVVAVGFFALRPAQESNDPRPVVKIGATLPLSGNLAPVGNAIKEAMLMARDEIPANSKYRYEIIIEDNLFEMRNVATDAHRLINMKNADVLISMFDGASVVIPIAEKAKVPHIGCTWGAKSFKDFQYSFNHWARPETQANAVVDLLKSKQINKIAAIGSQYGAAQEMISTIEKMAKHSGIEFTSVYYINNGTRDFAAEIEKIRMQKPDIILLQAMEPELSIFAKQAAEKNLNIPYTSVDKFVGAMNKELFNGSDFVLSPIGSDEFTAQMAKRTNLLVDECTANLYDAVKILVSVYESADHKLTGEELKDRLYQIKDYPSALGVRINVDEDGIIDAPLIRARIENGQVVRE